MVDRGSRPDDAEDQVPTLTTVSRRTFMLGSLGMGAMLALGLTPKAEAAPDFQQFSFAFISDTHLCTGLPDNTNLLQESQLFLQDVIKQLNNRQLDFVIFGGDQIEGTGKNDANWNLFIDCLQILNAPWYFVLGEADVSGRTPVDKMVEFGPDLKGRGLTSGKPYWSADPLTNVHIIGLDTSKPNTTTGDLSIEQLNWLKSDLAANKGKFTMAFSHHPLLPPPPYDGGPPWDDYMVLQGASAREILAGSRDVRLCVSGHVPINKVQQEGSVWYVSAATIAMYPCQFKIFTVTPQSIHVETLTVNYDALVKKARKMMESGRLAYQYSSARPASFLRLAEGEELDRNALLPLVSGAVSQKAEKKKGKDKKDEKPAKENKDEKESKAEKEGERDSSEAAPAKEKSGRHRSRREKSEEKKSEQVKSEQTGSEDAKSGETKADDAKSAAPEAETRNSGDSKADSKPDSKAGSKADSKADDLSPAPTP